MSSLVPERWRESLERLHNKVGSFLTRLVPGKEQDSAPEKITTEAIPPFMRRGGPLVDMYETSDELVVMAEVPGLNRDDFSVELAGRRLIIRGEKKNVREQKGADGHIISECRYGCFFRSVQLPYELDDTTVKADLSNGLLTIRLPKPEAERHRRYRVPIS